MTFTILQEVPYNSKRLIDLWLHLEAVRKWPKKHAGVDLFFDKAEELPFTFQLESGSALNVTFMMVQHRGLIVFMLSLSRGGRVHII